MHTGSAGSVKNVYPLRVQLELTICECTFERVWLRRLTDWTVMAGISSTNIDQ